MNIPKRARKWKPKNNEKKSLTFISDNETYEGTIFRNLIDNTLLHLGFFSDFFLHEAASAFWAREEPGLADNRRNSLERRNFFHGGLFLLKESAGLH